MRQPLSSGAVGYDRQKKGVLMSDMARRFPKFHVMEVEEHVQGGFEHTAGTVSLSFLVSHSDTNYAARMIAGAVNAHVHIRQKDSPDRYDEFYWRSTDQYAPDIVFGVNTGVGNGLMIDEDGNLITPIKYDYADLVLPHLDFDFQGDDAGILIAWGRYLDSDDAIRISNAGQLHYFCTCHIACINAILLAVPWGGPHSNTGGRTRDEIDTLYPEFAKQLHFFQKCPSKNGKAGYDFYIMKLREPLSLEEHDDLRKSVSTTAFNLEQRLRETARLFSAKRHLIERLMLEYDNFFTTLEEVKTEVVIQLGAIAEHSVAQLPYVTIPTYDDLVKSLPKEAPSLSYDWKMENLEAHHVSRNQWNTVHTLKDRAKVIIDTWLEFAPKFAKLYDNVCYECHGNMAIENLTATVVLRNTKLDEQMTQKYTFTFCESHLKHLNDILEAYLKAEKEAAQANTMIGAK